MKNLLRIALIIPCSLLSHGALGWDYEGHRIVNQLALAALPTNFPGFVKPAQAMERVTFLSGEPDRWRNVQDVSLAHASSPDHYIDLEQLADYGLNPEALPVFRYQFAGQLALARQAHPEKFPEIDPAHNRDHTRELVGFLPWAICENYSKLKSCFSYLRTFQESGGTPDEITNAEQNILYVMGTMGHYVGDASQPLHTTVHHHGWTGENPHHYTTETRFHSWIDGGYFAKVGGANLKDLQSRVQPAQLVSIHGTPAKPEEMLQAAMLFIIEQNKLVEPLYQMEKDGKLSGDGESGLQGKAFLESQLLKSGQLLADIWYSAWQQAGPDTYLERQLAHRKHGSAQK